MQILSRIIVLLLAASYATAVQAGMRCANGQYVNNGDKTIAVLMKCGEPDARERFESVTIDGEEVYLERWTYVPEKGKFTRYLEFQNGILKEISNGPRVK